MVMLQKVLLHRESRRVEAMVLEVAKNGPCFSQPATNSLPGRTSTTTPEATKITMGQVAEILSRNLNLPVLDRTGITSALNFTLRWNPDTADALERDEAMAALRSEISTAIARQLGLL
jgi:uncharacterized protein (TIGR03435 family)